MGTFRAVLIPPTSCPVYIHKYLIRSKRCFVPALLNPTSKFREFLLCLPTRVHRTLDSRSNAASHTPIACKLLEGTINKRQSRNLLITQLLRPEQRSSQKPYNATALITSEDWTSTKTDRHSVDIMFVDFIRRSLGRMESTASWFNGLRISLIEEIF